MGPSMMDSLLATSARPPLAHRPIPMMGLIGGRHGAVSDSGNAGTEENGDDADYDAEEEEGEEEEGEGEEEEEVVLSCRPGGDGSDEGGQPPHGIHLSTEPFPASESLHVLRCVCACMHAGCRVLRQGSRSFRHVHAGCSLLRWDWVQEC